jgi:hypothetical protein
MKRGDFIVYPDGTILTVRTLLPFRRAFMWVETPRQNKRRLSHNRRVRNFLAKRREAKFSLPS